MIIKYVVRMHECFTKCPDYNENGAMVGSGYCRSGCPHFGGVGEYKHEILCNSPSCMSVEDSQTDIKKILRIKRS